MVFNAEAVQESARQMWGGGRERNSLYLSNQWLLTEHQPCPRCGTASEVKPSPHLPEVVVVTEGDRVNI